jgi:hypothetical protein
MNEVSIQPVEGFRVILRGNRVLFRVGVGSLDLSAGQAVAVANVLRTWLEQETVKIGPDGRGIVV